MKASKPVKAAAKPQLPDGGTQEKTDRIERIRLAIADGTYEVDALAVSQAIVRKSVKARKDQPRAAGDDAAGG